MSRELKILQSELQSLRKFAYSLTTQMSDADDLVQDVVVKVLDQGIPKGVKAQAWLITLTRNLWIDQCRQQSVRERPQTQQKLNDDVAEVRDPADINEDRQIIESLRQMPEDLRALFSLVALEGYAYREAADMLDIPIGTVMSRMARARKILSEHLEAVQEPRYEPREPSK